MSEEEGDPLQPVPWEKMDQLVERLLRDVPRSLNLYGNVQTALKWRDTDASERIQVYATKNDDLENGAVVAIYRSTDAFFWVAVHSFCSDLTEVERALSMTKRIEWDSPRLIICFNGFPEELRPFIEECRARHQLTLVFDDHKPSKQWKTPQQLSSCTYTCPEDVRLAPLTRDAVPVIESHWVAYPGAGEHIGRLVEHNPSLGVYHTRTGELCAWLLCNECSELALLHVTDDHRRKGYAQLLCQAMSQQLLRRGIVAHARIRVVNTPSLALFQTLGFNESPDTLFVIVGKEGSRAHSQS